MKKTAIIIISALCLIIGLFAGVFASPYLSKGTAKSETSPVSENPENGQYALPDYEIDEILKLNPIDKEYSAKYYNAGSQTDMNIIIGEWIDAYEKIIQKGLKIVSDDTDYDTEDVKEAIDDFLKEYYSFLHEYKDNTVGHGSGDAALAGSYQLSMIREIALQLAERIYRTTGINIFDK